MIKIVGGWAACFGDVLDVVRKVVGGEEEDVWSGRRPPVCQRRGWDASSDEWDITPKYTPNPNKCNVCNYSAITQSGTCSPTVQKVIQPSWKSEHSYAHSHRGESTYLYSVKQVIDTNWKIEGAYIHRQCHCQWGHSAKLEPRADICLRTYWGEAPP